MKKKFLIFIALCCFQLPVHAADLIEVYLQALTSDPLYQQVIAQRLAAHQGVPINYAAIFPNIIFTANPSITRSGFAGSTFSPIGGASVSPRNNTQRAYTLTLTLTQTVFDFAKFARIAGAKATSRSADATLNAAIQDLMVRVAKAYFTILKDEDNLSYTEASKLAYAEQLDQVTQQYKVGLKTITDVYTAKASYDSAVAYNIAAQTTLANDRENLRVITGVYYPHLSSLSEKFPLLTPHPENVESWVCIALQQNWLIKAGQFDVETARQSIKQQVAGHLPTLNVQATLDRIYNDNINGYVTINQRTGPGAEIDRQIALNLNVPVFSGGGVIAQTDQAIFTFQAAQQKLEKTIRDTLNQTRQTYLSINSGISQINADKQAVKSTISSLQGMEASYRVGTETLVNVLNQQQKVFQAQTQYATDRYAFVNNILVLKQAAGILCFEDLQGINAWLIDKVKPSIPYNPYHANILSKAVKKAMHTKKFAQHKKSKKLLVKNKKNRKASAVKHA